MLTRHRAAENCEACRVEDAIRRPLTKRQAEVLVYATEFIATKGYPPSFEEIATHFEYGSLATVFEHLHNIERKGWIRRRYNECRSIEILAAPTPTGV